MRESSPDTSVLATIAAIPLLQAGLLAALTATAQAAAPVLPRPDAGSATYILPIGGAIGPKAKSIVVQQVAQLGRGSLYHRAGWANVFQPWNGDDVVGAARLADSLDLHLGVIFHQRPSRAAAKLADTLVKRDLREFQWRQDGRTWSGGTFKDALMNDGRNLRVPTNSRLARITPRVTDSLARWWAREVARAIAAYPDRIAAVNYVVEEEMPTGGEKTDSLLGDYSPFSIAEFRDWVRHAGIYDDSSGAHRGEGAPEAIVGPFVQVGRYQRSIYWDDPSPATSRGGNASFNATFGTAFTTWMLAFWDPDSFPAPIVDTTVDLTPAQGTGAIPGGFDAPRARDTSSRFWNAWSWDVLDHGSRITGQPRMSGAVPAFGFRQVLVKHFIDDQERLLRAAGIPANLLFRHQIPGEVVGASRLRSSASPAWTARSIDGGTVGITRFGAMDPDVATRWLDTVRVADAGWGIFEWHPRPGTGANAYIDSARRHSAELLQATYRDLDRYDTARCRVLFPGWWSTSGDPKDINWATFALPNSNFAVGIRTWRDTVNDVPFRDRGLRKPADYAAPAPLGLGRDSVRGRRIFLSWSDTLWSGFAARVADWKGHGLWRVQWSASQSAWKDTLCAAPRAGVPDSAIAVRVRLESATGVPGAWAELQGAVGTAPGRPETPGIEVRLRGGRATLLVAPQERIRVHETSGRLLAEGVASKDGNWSIPEQVHGVVIVQLPGSGRTARLLLP